MSAKIAFKITPSRWDRAIRNAVAIAEARCEALGQLTNRDIVHVAARHLLGENADADQLIECEDDVWSYLVRREKLRQRMNIV